MRQTMEKFISGQVRSFAKLLRTKADFQRDHRDSEFLDELRIKLGGAIGDNLN
jgi:hypothetical protein